MPGARDDEPRERQAEGDQRNEHQELERHEGAHELAGALPVGSSVSVVESTGMKAEEKAPSAKSFRRLLGMLKTAFIASAAPAPPK